MADLIELTVNRHLWDAVATGCSKEKGRPFLAYVHINIDAFGSVVCIAGGAARLMAASMPGTCHDIAPGFYSAPVKSDLYMQSKDSLTLRFGPVDLPDRPAYEAFMRIWPVAGYEPSIAHFGADQVKAVLAAEKALNSRVLVIPNGEMPAWVKCPGVPEFAGCLMPLRARVTEDTDTYRPDWLK